ncbi:hypothetical protein CKAN_02439900 [Cinnamomum micranthum f. kanehirae]|uniref:Uncharacterized protein n=1 Tax=Cinnamomum micranthum f. kanehirae TaxID=337451 RepID=A0A3S3R676_9MAGN|nr:hypothetical protein CKAN_02439900 [Cinnamomum micranthum f. kanehirae]
MEVGKEHLTKRGHDLLTYSNGEGGKGHVSSNMRKLGKNGSGERTSQEKGHNLLTCCNGEGGKSHVSHPRKEIPQGEEEKSIKPNSKVVPSYFLSWKLTLQ